MPVMADRRLVATGLLGAAVAAICCATPFLVPVLTALGLAAASGYLDVILLPAIVIFLAIAIYGLRRRA